MITRSYITHQPVVRQQIQSGIDQLLEAIRPTLGPVSRWVGLAPSAPGLKPELLDDGGLIARRITQLPNADVDIGAMLLRQLLWSVRESVGDGTATTAVLFQSILKQSAQLIAAGWNPMHLRKCLEDALPFLLDEIQLMSYHVPDATHIAHRFCEDDAMATIFGEIFDTLGAYALIDIHTGHTRGVEREYIPGMFWAGSGLLAASSMTDIATQTIELSSPLILATDLELENPRDLDTPLRCALQMGNRSLVIIARNVSDKVRGFLNSASNNQAFQIVVVKTPGQDTTTQMQALNDLARVVGCNPLVKATGQSLNSVTASDFGNAKNVWATRTNFGIRDGFNEEAVDAYVNDLQKQVKTSDDFQSRLKIYDRLGQYLGASAILRVGGVTDYDANNRRESARRALHSMRLGLIEGFVPGGGIGLYQIAYKCAARASATSDENECVIFELLAKALTEPMRAILSNSGIEPASIIASMQASEATGYIGYDVVGQQIVDMTEAGIVDPLTVVQTSVKGALKTAALCLTLDVIVHHQHPEQSIDP